MITDQDKKWLSQKYPKLVVNAGKISGEIEFTATYNEQTGFFLEIEKDTNDVVRGLHLSGKFKIRIEERTDISNSKLPALFVDGVEHVPNRHFNQTDGSGCVCNPLEEDEFLEPQFEFRKYLKELVIPFLYGQLFFTLKNQWPWHEYSHGCLGLLESYEKQPSELMAPKIERAAVIFRRDFNWKKYHKQLQKPNPNGACICGSKKPFQKCHTDAWNGLLHLHMELRRLNLDIYKLYRR